MELRLQGLHPREQVGAARASGQDAQPAARCIAVVAVGAGRPGGPGVGLVRDHPARDLDLHRRPIGTGGAGTSSRGTRGAGWTSRSTLGPRTLRQRSRRQARERASPRRRAPQAVAAGASKSGYARAGESCSRKGSRGVSRGCGEAFAGVPASRSAGGRHTGKARTGRERVADGRGRFARCADGGGDRGTRPSRGRCGVGSGARAA